MFCVHDPSERVRMRKCEREGARALRGGNKHTQRETHSIETTHTHTHTRTHAHTHTQTSAAALHHAGAGEREVGRLEGVVVGANDGPVLGVALPR